MYLNSTTVRRRPSAAFPHARLRAIPGSTGGTRRFPRVVVGPRRRSSPRSRPVRENGVLAMPRRGLDCWRSLSPAPARASTSSARIARPFDSRCVL